MSDGCTDRLEALLDHFPVRARMFHSGVLCAITDFPVAGSGGQMHLVRAGALQAIHPGHAVVDVAVPSLLLYPRPTARRFVTDARHGANLVCADLDFEGGDANPIASALPDIVCLPLDDVAGAGPVLGLLFDEAFGNNCGRHALINRLFEVVLIQVLRHLMEANRLGGGMLAGLSHPRLRAALVAMHERPGAPWSLGALAGLAGMSRSVFAGTFRRAVGCTPGAYLQSWRVRLVQQALHEGRSLKEIAADVGYGSEAALSRAFKSQCGLPPRQWRKEVSGGTR